MVFIAARPELSVIANQSADWCGNPPVEWNQVSITTKNRGDSHFFGCFSAHFLSNRGIATTSVRTGLAMTGNLEQSDKHQLIASCRVRGALLEKKSEETVPQQI